MKFDVENDFTGLLSAKWNFRTDNVGTENVIPMWVADMDFQTAPAIKAAIEKRASAGIYGYAKVPKEYSDALVHWFKTRHNWNIDAATVVPIPGVVPALHIAVEAFTEQGEGILLQTPVYHPFYRVCNHMNRKIIENPLIRTSDHYEIDWVDLESKLKNEKPKVMIICNPHNPTGKVFTKGELARIGYLCLEYHVIIIVDEIHCDIVYEDAEFISYATIAPELEANAIICTAPSKTFNIAGLRNSNIIIPNEYLRAQYIKTKEYFGYPGPGPFPLIACIAAYTEGAGWQDDVMKYIKENRDFALSFIRENIPKLQVHKPDGTYFLWLDFNAYGLTKEELEIFLVEKAGIWLNQGYIFGEAGEGFARMNIASPRALLTTALENLKIALDIDINIDKS